MPYHLKFHSLHNYDPAKSGITVPVTLRAGGASVALNAKIDTGATYCIFQRLYGEHLGLDIERGHHQLISHLLGAERPVNGLELVILVFAHHASLELCCLAARLASFPSCATRTRSSIDITVSGAVLPNCLR